MIQDERRAILGLEVRVGGGAKPRLVGWAAKFNARSLDLGGFVEIIRPGAFTRTLAGDTDILAFVEHNPSMILARRSVGNLVIGEDGQGLHVEITPPDTQAGRDVVENVRIGNLNAMSFAFRVAPDGDRWDLTGMPPLRELLNVDLREVSIVALAAYPATEVAMRSLEAIRSQAGKYPRGRTVRERLAWTKTHGL